jgi:hypothetical protein
MGHWLMRLDGLKAAQRIAIEITASSLIGYLIGERVMSQIVPFKSVGIVGFKHHHKSHAPPNAPKNGGW